MKLNTKLMLYYFIATLLTLALVGIIVLRGIERLGIKTFETQLIDQSRLAEIYITQLHSVGDDPSNSLSQETSKRVISKLGLILGNVRIYDRNLNIQASSKSNIQTAISDDENNKVLTAALNGNYAYVVKNNIVYFASPIEGQNNLIGILEIIAPISFIENLITEVIRILVVGAIVFTIIIAILIAIIAGKITRPINILAAAASNYANRKFIPVEISGSYEISKLSESFNTMGLQLQDYINRQKQFVSNVSHELRTPLTAIKGYSEYLKEEVNDRPDLQKAIYHLNNESERLYKLVEEVLTLSRIDSSGESFTFEKLDLSNITIETIEKMLLRADKYGIRVKYKLENNIFVLGDREKLIQVLINLLDNALKFSPPESSVEIGLRKDNNHALLSITDHGIGIPREAIDKVFERFYREANAQGVSGTGLGLSIVKYIVEAHKGSIELISDKGRGTTVKLSLPINKS